MTDTFDPYHKWLGIPPAEQPPDYYRLLGVNLFEADADVISHAADQRMAHLRSFQTGPQAAHSQRLLNEISLARVTLLNPTQRANYDAALQARLTLNVAVTPSAASPAAAPVIRTKKRSSRKEPRPALELVKIVGGGAFGLFFAVLLLSYFAGLDLLGWQKKSDDAAAPPAKSVASNVNPRPVTPPVAKRTVEPKLTGIAPTIPTSPPPPPTPVPRLPAAPFGAAEARQHQEAWAKHLSAPVEFTNSIGMKFRLIPPTEFTMGMTPEEAEAIAALIPADEYWRLLSLSSAPSHRVRLTQAYYLGAYEVTQEQYEKVMGSNPSYFSTQGAGKDRVAGEDTRRHPVHTVSFVDAAAFCMKLSLQEQLEPAYLDANGVLSSPPGDGYRLPTEAEWEGACRAGTTPAWFPGEQESTLATAAWFHANSGDVVHPVGQLRANPFGLYDVHGNVWEWCQDFHDPEAYVRRGAGPTLDPHGPEAGIARVLRGGHWADSSAACRSAFRDASEAGMRNPSYGFRVALGVSAARRSR